MEITITLKGKRCKTAQELADRLLETSETRRGAWLKAGNYALRAFPASPVQKLWQQVIEILR